jgi:hypothetical protein
LINFAAQIQHVDQLLINMLILCQFQLFDDLLINMLMLTGLGTISTCWTTVGQQLVISFNMLVDIDQLLINFMVSIQLVDQLLINKLNRGLSLVWKFNMLINWWSTFSVLNQHVDQLLINKLIFGSLRNQHVDQLLINKLILGREASQEARHPASQKRGGRKPSTQPARSGEKSTL